MGASAAISCTGDKTWVVVQLTEPAPGTVKVRLSQVGWQSGADWDRGFASFDQTWGVVLERLQRRFATGPLDWKSM